MNYVIYIKGPEINRFRPLGRTGPVANLFHAIMFPDYESAKADLESLTAANPDYTFQIRRK